MPDLRDRLRALDDLEVPDVMQQARLGPKAPMEPGPRPVRRIAIAAFALIVAAASVLYVTRAFDRSEAPLPPVRRPSSLPRAGGTHADGDPQFGDAGPKRSEARGWNVA